MSLKSGEVYFSEQSSSFTVPESISLFGFSVSFYGMCLVVAALIGIIVATEAARRKKQNIEWSLTLLTVVIVASLLGARIYYVLFEWQKFVKEPMALLNFRSGGLSYFGALFGAWGTVKWVCRRKNAEFAECADTISIGASAAAPFVWGGCAFVREPLGRFYDGLFSLRVGVEYLPSETEEKYFGDLLSNARTIRTVSYISMHPVALYGVVLSIVLCVILCIYAYKKKQKGAVFTMYLFFNALLCIVLEFFRGDRSCIWGTEIPVNYIVAVVILLTIIIGWVRTFWLNKKAKKKIFIKS